MSCLASARGVNSPASCNSPIEELTGSLRIKGAALATAATAWQAYYSQAPVPNSLGKIHALFLTRCRQEARNRELGMLRLGQAANIFPCWALQGRGACEAALIRIIRRLPALSSHRRKATEIVLLPVISGDSLPIRLNLPSGMGYAGRPLVRWAHRQLTDMRPPWPSRIKT